MAEKKETKEKPLDKMTVKELREIAKEIPDLVGVHGMKKDELLTAIKKAQGIEDTAEKKTSTAPKKKTGGAGKKKAALTVKDLKTMIKQLKAQRQEALAAKDKQKATIYRRRISRLKKKTRQAA